MITFPFFRQNQNAFSKNNQFGAVMQFIGRRTLDIYLLHYFVLPWGIKGFPDFLANNPLMSYYTSSALAILVMFVCLLISTVLRVHPSMGYYLFGAKN